MEKEKMMTIVTETMKKDITKEQAQAYLDGAEALPDELLDAINGGAIKKGDAKKKSTAVV